MEKQKLCWWQSSILERKVKILMDERVIWYLGNENDLSHSCGTDCITHCAMRWITIGFHITFICTQINDANRNLNIM